MANKLILPNAQYEQTIPVTPAPDYYGEPDNLTQFGLPAQFGDFIAAYSYQFNLTATAADGPAVGIITTNPDLASLIILQNYATGWVIKSSVHPTDPSIVYEILSQDFLFFTSQLQKLFMAKNGVPANYFQWHILTDQANFGNKQLKVYSTQGKTLQRNDTPLSNYITDQSFQQNIVQFPLGVNWQYDNAFVIETRPAPAVGTGESLDVTLQVA